MNHHILADIARANEALARPAEALHATAAATAPRSH
jgi:hypothetical protein